MKKLLLGFLAILLLSMTACGSGTSTDTSSSAEASQTNATHTCTLYADFSNGASDVERIVEYPVEYRGEEADAEWLARALNDLTGLDFAITATQSGNTVFVDWSSESTLLSGLGDTEPKEDFVFNDTDALNWFMLDSLWRTLQENLGAEDVYYTMDGGKALYVEGLSLVQTFSNDTPFMGSVFYAAHSDVRGDDEEESDLYSRPVDVLEDTSDAGDGNSPQEFIGDWYLYGDTNAESLIVSADSTWTFRTATGLDGNGGYIVCEGYTHRLNDGTLMLYENNGVEVGYAYLAGNGIAIMPVDAYAELLPSQEVFYR